MLFVLVAFFQTLGLTIITEPLTAFLNQLFEYAPRLIAAGVLVFLAWVVATVLRFVVRQVLAATKIDRHLTREAGVDKREDLPVAKTLSDATYWLVTCCSCLPCWTPWPFPACWRRLGTW